MNDNKFMFEAKRLDNGEMIEGSLLKNDSWAWITTGTHAISTKIGLNPFQAATFQVDPSTIKPLFTTDKRDVWMFENSNEIRFEQLAPCSQSEIYKAWIDGGGLEQHDGNNWHNAEDVSSIHRMYVYRVKAAGYSIDDALDDLHKILRGDESASDCRSVLEKFAKANGLGGDS